MKITDVTIRNFLTIGPEVKINLDNRGMVLITGDNRDDTSAISNGAGKSSIGDAICFAIYGTTARGESGDAVINNIVGKDCCVEVLVEDDGKVYSIARYRKHKVYKNSLQVITVPANDVLTKGTDKLTQDLVNKIIGCSYEVFRSAIYAGQDSIPNLPGMTDKNLKEIVEEAAGINRLAEAHVIARDEFKVRESSAFALSRDLLEAKFALASTQIEHTDLCAQLADFRDNVMDKRTRLETEKTHLLRDKLVLFASPLLAVDETSIRDEIQTLDDKLADFIATKSELDADERKIGDRMKATEGSFKAAIGKVKADLAKLESIQDRIGKPCGECGKDYCEEDLESAALIAKQELNKSKRAALEIKTTLADDKTAHAAALLAVNSFGSTAAALNTNKAASDALRAELNKAEQLCHEIKDAETKIMAIDLKISDLMTQDNPYVALVKRTELKIEVIEKMVNTTAVLEKAALVARDLSSDAVKVFSPAGVRAHVIDTVTPFLNDRTSHYLSTLSDGNISAVWNTLSKTKSGELREKFIIEVMNDKGASSFGGLSGGEKRKVRIATALALQDLVASRASKPFSLFIGDELDDSLDEAGLERLMMLLEEKAREKGTVLVISHNSISDWCSNQAMIIKEGGFSRIEGELVI